MYFSTGRKVPKAHRGGQSVHEGVAAPDPSYPNTLRAHCRGAALITPRGGDTQGMGGALKRHHIQHASSTGSLAWGGCSDGRGFAPAGASATSIVASKGRSFRLTRSAFSLSPQATKASLSAASIVAAKGRSFRLTRSAFSLSPQATKASLPKGLCGHCRSAFDFRLRRTCHWRGVALWKPLPTPDKGVWIMRRMEGLYRMKRLYGATNLII